jgi:alpha-L-arabinofuranosidase
VHAVCVAIEDVAGLSFDIFNRHADRVHMANIAQTVNVLQAMVLTEGPKMVLTPTYHVFDMYKVHQDATLLPLRLDCDRLTREGFDMPGLSASASRDADGRAHLSLCNLSAEESATVEVELRGAEAPRAAAGRILAASATDSHNDFARPDEVAPVAYEARVEGGRLVAKLPPMAVAVLEIT